MGAYNMVNRAAMQAGQAEDISVVVANLDAIAAVLNGGVDNTNIATGAGIAYSKLLLTNSIVNADIAAAAGILGSKLQFSVGATPPVGPANGDLWLLPADATNGINWLFRYNSGSASASKWEFIGGPPMRHEIQTSENCSSGAYADLGTVGPTITLPRAGDFQSSFGCMVNNNPNVGYQWYVAIKRGAAATSDNDAVQFTTGSGPSAQIFVSLARVLTLVGMAASDVVKMQYRQSGYGFFASARWLEILPVRVS